MTNLKGAASEEELSNSNPSSGDVHRDAVSKPIFVSHHNK
jgi:hypothetical protein